MKNNNSFNYFKGIATFIIIFTHIEGIINPIIKEISNLGYIAVSIFFSISGSLLIENFINKKNYEKNFIIKKLKRIYIPYIISNIIYIIIQIIFNNYNIKFINLIKDILGITIINDYTWYINELLLIYLIFYFLFKLEKKYKFINNTYNKYLILITTSYIILFILKINTKYLTFITCKNLSISLLIGMTLGLLKSQNKNLFQSKYIKNLLIISVIILHMFLIYTKTNDIIIPQVIIPIMTSFITQYKFKFNSTNNLFETLGKYSLEIYLLHIPILILYRNNIIYITNQLLYTTLYLITLTIAIIIFKKINNKIKIT